MNVGSLFSGVGGFDLGLERAGMRVIWQCEANEYRRAVLREHWPTVPCFDDVRAIGPDAEWVDLICGGFPCQPTSQAAARSHRGEGWLWPEMASVIRTLEPRWVLIENPEALRYAGRGLGHVLGDLADCGFDAEWQVVRASDLGAPHHRARVWVVAHSNGDRESVCSVDDETPILSEPPSPVPEWRVVPDLRMADGLSSRLDRTEALGDALVPQIAEWIGRRIMIREAGTADQERQNSKSQSGVKG